MLTDPGRLAAVAAATAAAASPHASLDRLTGIAARLTRTRYAFLSLVADELQVLTAAAGHESVALPASLPAHHSVCQHLVRHGVPLLVPDLQADPLLRGLTEVRDLGMRSYAGAPVRAPDGAVLGGLCVADGVVRDWTPDEAVLLTDLASAASSELWALVRVDELGRAHAEERRRAEEQATLHRIAASVVRGEVPQRVLQQAADELVRLLDAVAALVLRFRPDGGTSVVVTAGPVAATAQAWSWFGRMLRDLPPGGAVAGPDEDRPCAAVPITVAGQTWGALVIVLGEEGSRGQVEHLEQLAGFLSLVLVNAEAQLQLTRLARSDPLTGAPNRRVFEERLVVELARCDARGGRLLVALLDVDLFKQVNDRHGHDTGDAVLRLLPERVGEVLGDGDLLARLGGDEWGLLLPSDDGALDPLATLERVRAGVAAEPLAGVAVTVTLGGALVHGGLAPAEVLRRADAALYEAKRRGRDQVGLA
ncbi:MAG: diguanylate cyclase and metal dependent phosphohydrolase [Frankiales bacterium]|nr:diguanylate cyclase and metal dependent phosphohydrolase [Frankiales bacterium]